MAPTRSGTQYAPLQGQPSAKVSRPARSLVPSPVSSKSGSSSVPTLVPLGANEERMETTPRGSPDLENSRVSTLSELTGASDHFSTASPRGNGLSLEIAREPAMQSPSPPREPARMFSDVAAGRVRNWRKNVAALHVSLSGLEDIAPESSPGSGVDATSASRAGVDAAVPDDERSHSTSLDGFVHPKSPARLVKSEPSSPMLSSDARYFPEWFENSGQVHIKEEEMSVVLEWPEAEDTYLSSNDNPLDDGHGALPVIESESPDLDIAGTLLQIDEAVRNTLEERMRRVESARAVRAESGRKTPTDSSSNLDGKAGAVRACAVAVEVDDESISSASPAQWQVPVDKGKSVDPREHSGKAPTELSPESETDEERDEQIARDYNLAIRLQQHLESLEGRTSGMTEAEKDELVEAKLASDVLTRVLGKHGDAGHDSPGSRTKSKRAVPHKASSRKATSGKASSRKASSPPRQVPKRKSSGRRNEPTGKHDRASSLLPEDSRLKATLMGQRPKTKSKRYLPSDPSSSSLSSSSSSEPESGSDDYPRGRGNRRPERRDSSDSGSAGMFPTEPETESSADSEDTRREKKRAKRRYKKKMMRLRYAQSFLKLDPPFVYSGEVRADLYQKWVREVRLYLRYSGLTTAQGLLVLGKYLSGRAYKWYDREILSAGRDVTLSDFFLELFDYVFPPDFRSEQRDAFDDCHQRGRSVRDFLQNLLDLANTIGDVSDREIVVAFWRRCDAYLKVDMTREGYSPETLSLREIENIAIRLERTHRLVQKTSDRTRNERSHGGRSRDNQRDEKRSEVPKPADRQHDKSANKDKKSYQDAKREKDKQREADKAKRQRLRDEGRCFQCESKDHMLKDCPEKKVAKAPKLARVSAVAVDFAAVEERRALKAAASLGLCALAVSPPLPLSDEEIQVREEVLTAHAVCTLLAAVPLTLDKRFGAAYDRVYDRDRFDLYKNGPGEFILTDWHSCESHSLTLEQLGDPSFDIVHWLYQEKASRWDELIRVPSDAGWSAPPPSRAHPAESSNDDYSLDSDDDHSDGSSGLADSQYCVLSAVARPHNGRKAAQPAADSSMLERTSARVKDFDRRVPQPLVVSVLVNGEPTRALLDSGSMADFMSSLSWTN
ncbi:hypothetical protein EVG20_g2958 [Dentipellis fragilis]|uniref:CCHC-type domain-containing protein n=1 Tax=Dentipellis fragilis TaxID=205917 RepID=A0A4Y9Z7V3_9AGAM|nr:hypothetical protein EVG20_g2958 [Dentipellis fragilis]